MQTYVARSFTFDFVYLDLLFCAAWIGVLVWKRKYRSLLFGLAGALIVFLHDDLWWFHLAGTRHIAAPIQPDLFLVYFSFTYGMIEFSFVTLMVAAQGFRERLLWVLFLYGGWTATALLSQWLPLDERAIEVGREMSASRLMQVLMVAGGYALLAVLRLTWRRLASLPWSRIPYLFLVGVLVHFGMELSLLVSGIRPRTGSLDVLLFNSLLEFNSGVPVIFLAWTLLQRGQVPNRV